MCFSPAGDLIGGLTIVGVGVDACWHLRGRKELLAIASLPLLLGAHQIDETFVWWGLQGHVASSAGRTAMWIYLVFALVVIPVLIPVLIMMIEPTRHRRWRIAPFVAVGAAVAGVLLQALVTGHPSARLGSYHLAYSIGLRHGLVIIGFYVVATCGPLLLSGISKIFWLGVANLLAVVALARLCADGFTSLWCFYAALVSGVIALWLRRSDSVVTSVAHAGLPESPSPVGT